MTHTVFKNIADRLRREEGVALIVASGVILVLGIFVAAVAAGAIRVSDTSNNERSSKRALALADAGVRQAIHQLNQQQPADNKCPGDPVSGGKACAPVTVNTGFGDSFTFYTTTTLASGDPCAGEAINFRSPRFAGVERCIVGIGTSRGGETARVAARVAALTQGPEFTLPGILGYGCVAFGTDCTTGSPPCTAGSSGNPVIDADLGSNGQVCIGGNQADCDHAPNDPSPSVIQIGTGGSSPATGGSANCTPDAVPVGASLRQALMTCYFDPAPLDTAGGETCRSGVTNNDNPGAGDVTQRDPTDTRWNNNNAVLANNGTTPNTAQFAGNGCDTVAEQNATYIVSDNAGTTGHDMRNRVLDVPAQCTVTLPAGTYNFCRFALTKSSSNIVIGGINDGDDDPNDGDNPTIILIDSPFRPGSGCGAGQGGTGEPNAINDWTSMNNANATVPYCPGGDNSPGQADGCVVANNNADIGDSTHQVIIRAYGNPCAFAQYKTPPHPQACKSEQNDEFQCDTTKLNVTTPSPCTETASDERCCRISIKNGGNLFAGIDAPFSDADIKNGGNFTGGVAAATVSFNNNGTFAWSNPGSTTAGWLDKSWYQAQWSHCTNATVVPTNPAANC